MGYKEKRGQKNNSGWIDKIVVMMYVKQEIQRLDRLGFWPHHLPEIAATEDQLKAAEEHLGHSLDIDYRSFLGCANGWKGFLRTVDLFGTSDLIGSSLMDYAASMLEIIDEENVIAASGFSKAELLPIAVTREDKDLFVMSRATSHQPGVVIWFAGEEIDRFPTFEEYFLAMADYNRLVLEDLKKSEITQNGA